jgi:hypothetical protein
VIEDLARHGAEYVASYADELAAVVAGLTRLHPRWRDRVPYHTMEPRKLAQTKRLHLRWKLIIDGHGEWGIRVVWKNDAAGRPVKPYAAAMVPRYRPDGSPQFGRHSEQVLSAPMLAEAMGLPFDLVEEAVEAYREALVSGTYRWPRHDPRRFVREHVEARRTAREGVIQ